ncbi:conserved repeat domain-containing protein [Amycolatopsis xylanica]|uniref:Conserved repeat domain-containing protein n=1 Tax=Amycolatopsis xylanica TaxID=589385 RepID=A0A1H3H275_9PSEU|nr:conserved repeat domain-containing protein [Amycolatopsis xylanica]
MRISGKPGRFFVALALIFISAAIGAGPARAGVVKQFSLDYNEVVYGDFLYAGNGVMRCPVTADGAPTIPGYTPTICANSADRTDNQVNDQFFMQWSDVDSDPGTFDSSSASVTIPPGAKITFARLNWAGNTGVYNYAPNVPLPTKMCQDRLNRTPAVLPDGKPADQKVRLTVGGDAATDLAPSGYIEDPSNSYSGGQYYSAYSDVTGQFAKAPTGSPLKLTVGNVWAPKGFNCMGGWSIDLVYAYPERNPDFAPNKREVFIYNGHVRQNSGDPTTPTTITGFRAAAADAHVGVTAYEGDWGIDGDQFLINDKPVAEPTTGSDKNFFISNTDNATAPNVKNNFSVDAKSFNVTTIAAGSTSAKLGFVTSRDSYLAQNLAFSTPVPELQITKKADPKVVHAGNQVTFTIEVKNPSNAPASGVRVVDDAFPACSRVIGNLKGGQSTTYTCTATAPADDFTNTAKVTGTSALNEPLDGSSSVTVDVVHPAIGLTKKADKDGYRTGETVTFTMTVTNTGDVPLTAITVADPKTPSCARRVPGTLAAGQSSTFTCTTQAPVPDGVNTATVTGVDGLGQRVDASADAPVPVVAPAITIEKSASPETIHAGDTVTWTIKVTNTGDTPLQSIKTTDDTTTACSRSLTNLNPGGSETYTCTANPSETTTNTVNVTASDFFGGPPVTATDSATVTVLSPALSITKEASPRVVRAGDEITFTIAVTNTGDVPLTGVTVTDDRTPSCAKTIGTLLPKQSQTHTCTAKAPDSGFTNTATATGKDPLAKEVKVTADAAVEVIHPSVSIVKDAAPAVVRSGDTVTYTITVTNTGDATLTGVAVADARIPACDKTLGTLQPKATQTYTCTTVAGEQGFTNTAKVTGTDPTNRPVDATDDATFTVTHPAITLAKDVTGGPFREGDTVPFQLTVTNTGDVPLTGVQVTDPLVTACAQTYDGTLAPGAAWTFGCTFVAGKDDFTNVASVTGTPPVGPPVTATDDTPVDVIHPAVTITKDATPMVVRAGDTVTFTLTVTNTGDSPLSAVTVTDPIAPACAKTLGTLAPQAKQTYTCTLVAGKDDFTNVASVTGTDPSNRPVTATDDASVDVIHPAVTITKDAAPTAVREGDTVTFTLVVKNTGDVPLTSVSIVDDKTPACARAFDTLGAGAQQQFTCTVVAGADGFTNTAKVTGTDPTGRQVDATDDATFTVLHPGISITKDVKGGPFRAGDTVTFTLTVANTGDSPLTAVTVTDELAPNCARTFDTLAAGASQTYECTMTAPADDAVNVAKVSGTPPTGPPLTTSDDAKIDVIHPAVKITKEASPRTVRAGDDVTFTIVVTNTGDVPLTDVSIVDSQTSSCAKTFARLEGVETYQCTTKAPQDDFTNTAVVTGNDPTSRPVTDTATATVDVIHPAVTITKDASPGAVREGDTVTFTLVVKNTGDVTLAPVSIVDSKTPSCSRTFDSLAAGAQQQFTCTVVAGAQGFTNTATVTGTDPLQRPVTATDDATFTVQRPGISITKNTKGGPFRTGDSVTFEIVVTNTGDVPLKDVKVTDPLAPECARTFPSLPANGVQRYPCTMTAPADDVTNKASVTGTPPVGPPVTATAEAPVDVIYPGIKLTKQASPTQVRPGEQVTFTLTVTNTGDVPLKSVSIVDDKTPACAFTIEVLAPGASQSHQCTTNPQAGITNTATATGTDPTNRPVTSTSTATVTVIGPGISITKTADPKPLLTGQQATFTLIVKNTGDVPLTDVTVTDPLAPACATTLGTLAPGESSKPITCTVTMPDHDLTNIATATGNDPTGRPVVSTDDATVKLAKPAITLTKKADATTTPGATVTFTLTVTNTGNVDLAPVKAADPAYPQCDRAFDRLPAGEHQEWTCTATAPHSGDLTNTATATGTPDTAQPATPVTDTATAIVKVNTPSTPDVTPPPSHPKPLANTGFDPVPPSLVALGLLLAGTLLVLRPRRR